MLYSEIADTSSLDLAIVNGIFDCSPTFQPLGLASVWAMKQEKVDVAQATLLHRLLDRPTRCLVAGIAG